MIAAYKKLGYEHIGLCIDFATKDAEVIEQGLSQGNKDVCYHLIHIVETAAARYTGGVVHDLETKADADNLQNYVDQLTAMGFRAKLHLGYGNVPAGISKIVEDNKIDFLIIGAHGHRGIKDLVLGTTVDALRHRIKVPLLIVQ